MQNGDPSRQALREHDDPGELATPVPWFVLVVAVLSAVWGVHAIVNSGLVGGPEWGDRRTRSALQATPRSSAAGAPAAADGAAIYSASCAGCHQATGAGVAGVFPPLAGSAWVKGGDTTLVRILLHGVTGTITVSGGAYSGTMPPYKDQLGDAELAALASYIRSQWGNGAAPVTAARVAQVRAATAGRKDSWHGEAELTARP